MAAALRAAMLPLLHAFPHGSTKEKQHEGHEGQFLFFVRFALFVIQE
jgi:hypothetical protein